MLYAQLGGAALGWLRERKIIHRNIRPNVILLQTSGRLQARLTGFSECFIGTPARGLPENDYDPWVKMSMRYRAPEMRGGDEYSYPVDMYSLSAVIDQALSHPTVFVNGTFLRDLVTSGLEQHPAPRLTPQDLHLRVEQAIGSLEVSWPPFRTAQASRSFALECYRSKGVEYVSRSSLQEVLGALRHSGHEAVTTSDLKWAYGGQQERIKLRRVAKFCRSCHLKQLAESLMEAVDGRRNWKEYFQVPFEVHLDVPYHSPSLMVSVTQILRVAGISTLSEIDDTTCAQNLTVYGPWEGEYIDFPSFQRISGKIEEMYSMKIRLLDFYQSNNPQMKQRMSDIDGSKYGLLIANQLHPHMVLLRKSDWAVHRDQLFGEPSAWEQWSDDSSYLSMEDARQLCSSHRMQQSMTMLDHLPLNASKVSPVSSIIEDQDESVTSAYTTSSFKKEETEQRDEREEHFMIRKRPKYIESDANLKTRVVKWSSDTQDWVSAEKHLTEL